MQGHFSMSKRMEFSRNLRRSARRVGLTGFCALALLLPCAFYAANAHREINGKSAEEHITLGAAEPGALYAVTVSVKDPEELQSTQSVRASIADASGPVAEKWLHASDLDFYLTLRPHTRG
ncbi:MAG: hypothetical protein ACREMY_33385, partial [bacterium]